MSLFAKLPWVFLTAVVLVGCVNTPTRTSNVIDDRPTITFNAPLTGDVLVLDGVEIGPADKYVSGWTSLKIEPGTHNLEIVRNGETVFSERFYISNGTSKSFNVPGEQ